jgi:hypothetical protein
VAKDLFAGAVGGVAQVLIGRSLFFSFLSFRIFGVGVEGRLDEQGIGGGLGLGDAGLVEISELFGREKGVARPFTREEDV